MAITVRVQNFQSIADATVVIDGLTVVTGPNNSGKSSLMRAIRGVFTNPAADSLVRHGAPHLIVTVTFDDGNVVIWKKGWEKTYQKGKRIQEYQINGKKLSKLGKGGVPDEVSALGIQAIQAGSSPIWPQIARQFTGQVFLMDKPGSVMAEAIADVERVGKLGKALKLADKDKRAATSELKTRRKDAIKLEASLAEYEGLGEVAIQVKALDVQAAGLVGIRVEEAALTVLHERLQQATEEAEALAGVERVVIPTENEVALVTRVKGGVWNLMGLHQRLQSTQATVAAVEGIEAVEVGGDPVEAEGLRGEINSLGSLGSRLEAAQGDLSLWERAAEAVGNVSLEDSDYPQRVRNAVRAYQDFHDRYKAALGQVTELEASLEARTAELATAETEVADLLGTLEACPTCQRPMSAGEHNHS